MPWMCPLPSDPKKAAIFNSFKEESSKAAGEPVKKSLPEDDDNMSWSNFSLSTILSLAPIFKYMKVGASKAGKKSLPEEDDNMSLLDFSVSTTSSLSTFDPRESFDDDMSSSCGTSIYQFDLPGFELFTADLDDAIDDDFSL
jgi:hypothetical protein